MKSLRQMNREGLGGHVHVQTQTTYGTPTFVGARPKGKPIKVAHRPGRIYPVHVDRGKSSSTVAGGMTDEQTQA